MLLQQAGLLEAQDLSSRDGMHFAPKWLTWQGHEFLEAARDDSRWKKALELLRAKGGGLVFDVLKAVLVDGVKRAAIG
jgi:hypothetical protein